MRVFLRKTLSGLVAADDASRETLTKYKAGEVYRADIVKPRSYQHHKLCMALLSLTFQNQDRYDNFENFRKAVAVEAGHVETLLTLQGELLQIPGSLSYEKLDEAEFTKVMAAMMTVCARILDIAEPELAGEVSRYADQNYGMVA